MNAENTEEFKIEGVSLVIPAYREELAIAGVIEEYRQALERLGYPYEIIVVDDASPDRTGELAMKAGARVIRHMHNRGGGAARKTGIKAARWDAVLMTDGDGTYPADALGEIIDRLR